MPSRHLVDRDLLPWLESRPNTPFSLELLPLIRAGYRELMLAAGGAPLPGVETETRTIPGPPGAPDVNVIVTQPVAKVSNRPALLHIHGGGYIIGSADMGVATDQTYASRLGAVVVSVDYRLAPETPYPGPIEDCYAALAWLFDHAKDLGVDPDRIAVTGESAGGGLAAALALLARDRGRYRIAFQHLVFPMLDDRTVIREDPSPLHGQYVWTPHSNRFGWSSYLGQPAGGPDVSPYAAPARATDLSGLPPAFIVCGALDLFLEEDMEYARRLIRAGVPTEFHVYPGAPHAFMMVPDAWVSKTFARDSLASLERAFGL
jgi:triacylglycerol lipase